MVSVVRTENPLYWIRIIEISSFLKHSWKAFPSSHFLSSFHWLTFCPSFKVTTTTVFSLNFERLHFFKGGFQALKIAFPRVSARCVTEKLRFRKKIVKHYWKGRFAEALVVSVRLLSLPWMPLARKGKEWDRDEGGEEKREKFLGNFCRHVNPYVICCCITVSYTLVMTFLSYYYSLGLSKWKSFIFCKSAEGGAAGLLAAPSVTFTTVFSTFFHLCRILIVKSITKQKLLPLVLL